MTPTTLRLVHEDAQISVASEGNVALDVGAAVTASADGDPDLAVDLPR
jgi:hypothetical protein